MARKKQEEIRIVQKNSQYEILKDDVLTRSNAFIRSRYTSSLLENQILLFSIRELKHNYSNTVKIPVKILKQLLNRQGNSLYRDIKKVSLSLAGRYVFIEDEKKHAFRIINLISMAEYSNGMLTLVFSDYIMPHINSIVGSSFTSMRLIDLFSFKTNAALRLYEVLRSELYHVNKDDNIPYPVELRLVELKMMLNLFDTDNGKLRNAILENDYDKIQKIQNPLPDYYEFKRKVLDKAVKEINSLNLDLYVDYKPVKAGRGGKVYAIRFLINHTMPQKLSECPYSDDSDAKLIRIMEVMQEASVSVSEASALLTEADGDLDIVIQSYEMAKKQKYIENLTGWMISCIRSGGYKEKSVIEGSEARFEHSAKLKSVYDGYVKEHKESLFEDAWKRMKESVIYPEFADYISVTLQMDPFFFENLYSNEDKIKMYRQWMEQKAKVY